jgi:hypothetical protein
MHCQGGYPEYVRRSHYLFTDLQAPILLRRVFFVVPTRPSPIKATNDCTVTSAACLEIVG